MFSTIERSQVGSRLAIEPSPRTFSLFWLLLPVGLAALAHALYYNYTNNNYPITFVYDSEFYRQTCSMFVQIVKLLHFGFSEAAGGQGIAGLSLILASLSKSALLREFVGHVRVDGPVLTVLTAIPCLLTGKILAPVDWRIVVVLQSLLYSCSVIFTGAIAARLTDSKKCGVLASLLYALYPPACLATNRFLTETTAVFLATGYMTLLCTGGASKPVSAWRNLLIGVLAGLAFMLRPAMALSIALPGLCFVVGRHRWSESFRSLALTACGAALAIMPWTIFSAVFLGHPLIAPDREPGLNLALGFDIESGGNAVIYMSPFAALTYDPQGPWQAAFGMMHARPWDFAKFLLWKLEKMALFPWNDFHHQFIGLVAGQQFFLHVSLMGLSLLGLIAFGACYKRHTENQKYIFCLCLAFLIGCLPVLLFVTVNRYLFPATPIMALLSAYAVGYITRQKRESLVLVAAAWLLIAGLYAGSYSFLAPEAHERKLELKPGDTLVRNLTLAQLPQAKDLNAAVLIVDGDNITSETKVSINGKALPGVFAPLYYFDSDNYSSVALDELTTAGRRTNVPCLENMRIWRGISVPISSLKAGINEFAVSQGMGASTIYSDVSKSERRLPSLFLFSDDIFWQNSLAADGRPEEPILSAGNANHEQFVCRHLGRQDEQVSTRPRLRLVFAKLDRLAPTVSPKHEVCVPLGAAVKEQTGETKKDPVQVQKAISEESKAPLSVKISQLLFVPNPQAVSRCSLVVDANNRSAEHIERFKPMTAPDHWVEIRGKVRSIKQGQSQPSILTTMEYNDYNAAIEVPAQSHITATKHWAPFCCTALIAHPNHVSLKSAIIDVYAEDIQLLRERGPRPQSCSASEFADFQLRVIPVTIPQCNFKRRIIL